MGGDKATWTQTLGDWTGAHTRSCSHRRRATSHRSRQCQVAVIKACRYEPQVNPTYAEMAAHYGTAVLFAWAAPAARQGKVEACVLSVERGSSVVYVRPFYSLAELNTAIGELLHRHDEERPIRRLGITRRQLLEELDRPARRACAYQCALGELREVILQ
jgi:transposase